MFLASLEAAITKGFVYIEKSKQNTPMEVHQPDCPCLYCKHFHMNLDRTKEYF